jgi:hypothetical protein
MNKLRRLFKHPNTPIIVVGITLFVLTCGSMWLAVAAVVARSYRLETGARVEVYGQEACVVSKGYGSGCDTFRLRMVDDLSLREFNISEITIKETR